MPRRLATLGLVTLGLATATTPAHAATPTARPSATSAGSLLFVQSASRGRLERTKSGLRLSLKVSRYTQTFTDRPIRRAGRETTRHFVQRWRARGFRSDPPNAAISIDRARGGSGVIELRHPRYAKGWLYYSVRRIPKGGKLRTGRFGTASLFIDNAPAGFCQYAEQMDLEAQFPDGQVPGCPAPSRRAILTVRIPPFTGSITVSLVSPASALFTQANSYGSGPFGVNQNSTQSVNIGGCNCAGYTAYLPLFVEGYTDQFTIVASTPTSISRDSDNFVTVGPNQPQTFQFFPAATAKPGS